MRLMAIDIGNQRLKCGRFSLEGDLTPQQTLTLTDVQASSLQQLESLIDSSPCFWSVSSVNEPWSTALSQWVSDRRPQDYFLRIENREIELPSKVDSRQQVGRDRMLAALAAVHRIGVDDLEATQFAPPLIVVDSGTAVTVDWVSEGGVFEGGYIFPGIETAFRQLSGRTDALPDLDYSFRSARCCEQSEIRPSDVGRNTIDAIILGVYSSQVGSLVQITHALLQRYQHSPRKPHVFLTGGGIEELQMAHRSGWIGEAQKELWPMDWEHVPNLVLQGAALIGRQQLPSHADRSG